MLQRTPTSLVYLSAEELGITERERAGLIEVRDDLASGVLPAHRFNMGTSGYSETCGTIACIGGHMHCRLSEDHSQMGMETYVYVGRSASLSALFLPRTSRRYSSLGTEIALAAIDHFLAGSGPDCWPMALADVPPA